jgi:hypothetical protein
MNTALRWANELGPPPKLSPYFLAAYERAKLVRDVNTEALAKALFKDYQGQLSVEEKGKCLNTVAELSKIHLPSVADPTTRANISLRMWSGCLAAAKTIAVQTLAGPNTPDQRNLIFREHIDPQAEADPIFCAGVESAPSFKKLLEEGYSLDGVPQESPVRRYEE